MRRRGPGPRLQASPGRLFFLAFEGVALYADGMWIGAAVLAILVVAAVPAFIEAGGSSLRGLGWLIVATGAAPLASPPPPPLDPSRSPLLTHHSPFTVRHSSFAIYRSEDAIRPTSPRVA